MWSREVQTIRPAKMDSSACSTSAFDVSCSEAVILVEGK